MNVYSTPKKCAAETRCMGAEEKRRLLFLDHPSRDWTSDICYIKQNLRMFKASSLNELSCLVNEVFLLNAELMLLKKYDPLGITRIGELILSPIALMCLSFLAMLTIQDI
ncbi:hypothetical protein H1C71_025606 [Ictidomys tridecemlineatus]|nr:hypothetical protein H1C71_025606 [Ictidomys tridecemlineatus]